MAVNPALVPSFRFPNNISDSEVHPEVRKAIKSTFQALTDIYSAIPKLKAQIDAKTTIVTSVASIAGPAPNTPTIIPGNMPAIAHEWLNSYDSLSGSFGQTQPAFVDISGVAASGQIPFPTVSTIGGVEAIAPVTHEWIDQIDTSGVPHLSQPAFGDISGILAVGQLPVSVPVVSFGSGAPVGSSTEGFIYFDTSVAPYNGYVYHSSAWHQFS